MTGNIAESFNWKQQTFIEAGSIAVTSSQPDHNKRPYRIIATRIAETMLPASSKK
jgi:ribosomal protein L13